MSDEQEHERGERSHEQAEHDEQDSVQLHRRVHELLTDIPPTVRTVRAMRNRRRVIE